MKFCSIKNLMLLGVLAASLTAVQSASAGWRYGYYTYYHATPVAVTYVPTVTVTPATVVVQKPTVVEVAIATPSVETEFATGATIGLGANFLGNEPGFALLKLDNNVTLKAELKKWSPTGVIIKLPEAGINGSVGGRIEILMPTGQLARSTRVRLVPKPDLVVFQDHSGPEQAITATGHSTARPDFSNTGLNYVPETSSTILPASSR